MSPMDLDGIHYGHSVTNVCMSESESMKESQPIGACVS